jgi:hypothetical protein
LLTPVGEGGGHRGRGESAADDRAVATAPALRDRLELNRRIRVGGHGPLGDPSFPAASATGAFIAAFIWQPLFGGVMIGAEVGRMTSRFGASRVPKYGRFMAIAENG